MATKMEVEEYIIKIILLNMKEISFMINSKEKEDLIGMMMNIMLGNLKMV